MKEFTDLLSKQGVIVQRIAGSEGDDLVFAWTTYLNANNESCIIWSGDSDLMQLVNYNRSTNSFTLWYDNTRGTLGVYPGFNKWLDTKEGKDENNLVSNRSITINLLLQNCLLTKHSKRREIEIITSLTRPHPSQTLLIRQISTN